MLECAVQAIVAGSLLAGLCVAAAVAVLSAVTHIAASCLMVIAAAAAAVVVAAAAAAGTGAGVHVSQTPFKQLWKDEAHTQVHCFIQRCNQLQV
jgi:hypothetical protein